MKLAGLSLGLLAFAALIAVSSACAQTQDANTVRQRNGFVHRRLLESTPEAAPQAAGPEGQAGQAGPEDKQDAVPQAGNSGPDSWQWWGGGGGQIWRPVTGGGWRDRNWDRWDSWGGLNNAQAAPMDSQAVATAAATTPQATPAEQPQVAADQAASAATAP